MHSPYVTELFRSHYISRSDTSHWRTAHKWFQSEEMGPLNCWLSKLGKSVTNTAKWFRVCIANTVLMCLYDITGSREVTYPWKTTCAVDGLHCWGTRTQRQVQEYFVIYLTMLLSVTETI
jgi:hypothetical protein